MMAVVCGQGLWLGHRSEGWGPGLPSQLPSLVALVGGWGLGHPSVRVPPKLQVRLPPRPSSPSVRAHTTTRAGPRPGLCLVEMVLQAGDGARLAVQVLLLRPVGEDKACH